MALRSIDQATVHRAKILLAGALHGILQIQDVHLFDQGTDQECFLPGFRRTCDQRIVKLLKFCTIEFSGLPFCGVIQSIGGQQSQHGIHMALFGPWDVDKNALPVKCVQGVIDVAGKLFLFAHVEEVRLLGFS